MDLTHRRLQNIFSDRASLVLRALLGHPGRSWVARDFAGLGVSPALANMVLQRAETLGFVERRKKGWDSFSHLVQKDELLKAWTAFYRFDLNRYAWYSTTKPNFLNSARDLFRERDIPFALTLFSASRRLSPYLVDKREFVCLGTSPQETIGLLKEMENRLGLAQVSHGGNVCLLVPFYRHSGLRDLRSVKGYPLVSDLQLYLDLMSFPPTGVQEVEENLIPYWKERAVPFA